MSSNLTSAERIRRFKSRVKRFAEPEKSPQNAVITIKLDQIDEVPTELSSEEENLKDDSGLRATSSRCHFRPQNIFEIAREVNESGIHNCSS